jgi:PPOX class probable F420-dependent enzyme
MSPGVLPPTIESVESVDADGGSMMSAVAMSAPTTSLADTKFVLLTTYRKNGAPVATPVCHVVHEGKIYVVTLESTWKAKRLRRNSRVLLASCDMRGSASGPVYSGEARILDEEEVRNSPVFKRHGLLGAAFRRRTDAHWIVKPIQLFERIAYRHKFIGVVIEPSTQIEVAA